MQAFVRSRSGRVVPSRGVFATVVCCLLSVPAVRGQVSADAATSTSNPPQIITVQVPQENQGQRLSNTTDWSRTANTAAARQQQGTRETQEAAFTPTQLPDRPTEFQNLVQQTIGITLPVFGADLFNNPPSTFAPLNGAQVAPDYVIGPGDDIVLSATGQLNQQGTFTVNRAGSITIPEAGTFTVGGLRFSELKPFLTRQLGRVYRNFDLNVTLGQLRSIQIYILGQTRRPGSYTVSSLSTLVNALFVSGGVLPQGSLRNIQLRRGNNIVTTVDLYDLLLHGDKSRDITLQSGDILFVPAAGPQVAIAGSVTNPAIYELKNETSLGELLSLANGVTSTAANTGVRIEGVLNHTDRTLANLDLAVARETPLHPGDIVTVGTVSDRFADAVTLRGNVANPGRYVFKPGMRLSDLLPNRDVVLSRRYFRDRNQLGNVQFPLAQPAGTPPAPPTPATLQDTGHIAVSSTQSTNSSAPSTAASTPSVTTTNSASANGGGTTVGDALTQGNGTFAATNDVVLSAPDVDLAYAVIERLDPVTLTTSLIPFNLGAVLDGNDSSQNLPLAAGDVVTIFSKSDIRVPQSQQTRFVRLEGEFVAAGVYSVHPGETLRQLVARAGGLTHDAYLYASEFTRQSTRRVEQQRLREYADSLESQIDTSVSANVAGAVDPASASTVAAAGAQGARAAVARIRALQPTGRIVLNVAPDASGIDAIPDIQLEDADRFIVPRQPTSVAVAGEVYNASSFLYAPNQQVRDYLHNAGGPDRNADAKRIYVIRADGSVVSRQYDNVLKTRVLPGDTIVMPPQLTHRNILRDIATIGNALGALAIPLSLVALLQ